MQWKSVPLLFGLCESQDFTLIPAALFREEDAAAYLRFNTAWSGTGDPAWSPIPESEMVAVYASLDYVETYIQPIWPGTTLRHAAGHIIALMARSRFKSRSQFSIVYGAAPNYLIFIFQSGSLVLANSIEAHDQNDLLYFLFFAFKQFEMINKMDMLMLGECADDKALEQRLVPYVNVIQHCHASDFGLKETGESDFMGKLIMGYSGVACA